VTGNTDTSAQVVARPTQAKAGLEWAMRLKQSGEGKRVSLPGRRISIVRVGDDTFTSATFESETNGNAMIKRGNHPREETEALLLLR